LLIGSAQKANLWRVTRVEVDSANRYIFTIVPVRLTNGLPTPKFTSITDAMIRQEPERHWSELQDARQPPLLRRRHVSEERGGESALLCSPYRRAHHVVQQESR
jgi:hypothetical protein